MTVRRTTREVAIFTAIKKSSRNVGMGMMNITITAITPTATRISLFLSQDVTLDVLASAIFPSPW
jgi:hypothetical protein